MIFFTSYLLPILYGLLFAFLLQRNKYLLGNGLSRMAIIVFFTAKCIAGIAADFISLHYFPNGGDVYLYFSDGLTLYQTLLHSPGQFIVQLKNMFRIEDFDLLNANSDFIRTVFETIKFIHFVADFFSFGNVYTNTIFFNALTSLAFLKCWVFLKKYTGSWMAGAWIFLFPSAFFYTSNILKEGIASALIASLIPLVYKWRLRFSIRSAVLFLFYFLLLFFFKFLIAITFSGAMLIWFFVARFPASKTWALLVFTAICISGFFLSASFFTGLNLPQYLVKRQQEFMSLKANSTIAVYVLEPTFISFVKAFPTAIKNVLFKSLPAAGGKLLYILHAIEIYIFWASIVYLAVKNRFSMQPQLVRPLFWGMLLFALGNLLIIGYIVPNLGAIVRYRSIFLPWIGLFAWYLFNGIEHLPYLDRLLSAKAGN